MKQNKANRIYEITVCAYLSTIPYLTVNVHVVQYEINRLFDSFYSIL